MEEPRQVRDERGGLGRQTVRNSDSQATRKTLDERAQMSDIERLRHSTAHVLATAIARLWPDAQFAAGPPVEGGYYYDVDLKHRISPDDFPQIEAEIKSKTEEWDKVLQEEKSAYEVKIAQVRADAKVYETRTRAEGDAEAIALEAEGQLAIDQAEAMRDELRNQILNTKGGSIFLALEAAENLLVSGVAHRESVWCGWIIDPPPGGWGYL